MSSDFEVIPEVSEKTSIYPTLPSEEQTRLWKTNLMQPENKDGRETAEKMDTSAEDIKDNNEKEDKVEAALKTMQAMGFSTMVDGFPASLKPRVEMSARSWTPSSLS